MESTLNYLPGVLEVRARLVSEKMGEAKVFYNPDQATMESLRDAVPGASGEHHNFIVVCVDEDIQSMA